MTWKDLEIATLQKMFAIDGKTLVSDDATKPYLASLPQAVNEAMGLIAAAVPLKECYVIHQESTLTDTALRNSGESYVQTQESGVYRYDFSSLVPDFGAFDFSNMFFTDADGNYSALPHYDVEAARVLILDATLEGEFRIWYKAKPAAISITADTAETYKIPLPPECCDIIPLYAASQLYKDDDISMATVWRNEFETALSTLAEKAAADSGGSSGSFRSVNGWY